MIEGRRIDNRLEGGPGLAMGLDGAIVLTAAEIVAADHGPDGALARLQRNQPSLDERRLLQLHMHNITIELLHHDLDHIAGLQHLLEIRIDESVLHGIRPGQTPLRPGHIFKGEPGSHRTDLRHIMILRHFRDDRFPVISRLENLPGSCPHNGRNRRSRIDRSKRTPPPLSLIQFAQAGGKGRFCGLLHLHVQSRKDLEPALIDQGLAVLGYQQLPDMLHKVGRSLFPAWPPEIQRFRRRFFMLCRGQKSRLFHAGQHMLLSFLSSVIGFKRRIIIGRLGEAREKRGFRRREDREVFPEIGLRGRGDPIGALPEIDLVQIQFENFILRQHQLHLIGQDQLTDLAIEGPF